MAFSGTPIIKQIADNKVRITGVQVLIGQGPGEVGLHGSGAEVELPAAFQPHQYTLHGAVPLQDRVNAYANMVSANNAQGPLILKTGTTVGDFRIQFFDIATSAPGLEIIISFH